jgi:NTE family protein
MNGEQKHRASLRSMARNLPGRIVLVLQGGGALGSYQAGVYQALQEAGIEPDWIIGTSIGAINASLIAGNAPAQRLSKFPASTSGCPIGPPLRTAFPDSSGPIHWRMPVTAIRSAPNGPAIIPRRPWRRRSRNSSTWTCSTVASRA